MHNLENVQICAKWPYLQIRFSLNFSKIIESVELRYNNKFQIILPNNRVYRPGSCIYKVWLCFWPCGEDLITGQLLLCVRAAQQANWNRKAERVKITFSVFCSKVISYLYTVLFCYFTPTLCMHVHPQISPRSPISLLAPLGSWYIIQVYESYLPPPPPPHKFQPGNRALEDRCYWAYYDFIYISGIKLIGPWLG